MNIRKTTEHWNDLPPGAKVVGKRQPPRVGTLTSYKPGGCTFGGAGWHVPTRF